MHPVSQKTAVKVTAHHFQRVIILNRILSDYVKAAVAQGERAIDYTSSIISPAQHNLN